jgi:hypothetical protein
MNFSGQGEDTSESIGRWLLVDWVLSIVSVLYAPKMCGMYSITLYALDKGPRLN